MLEQIGGVIGGNKSLKIEAQISEQQLQVAVLYIFVAVFVAMVLANLLVKR